MTSNPDPPLTDSHEAILSDLESFISCSAPGKIILFGEHSVVYGATAVVGSIAHRTTLTLAVPIELSGSSLKFFSIYVHNKTNDKQQLVAKLSHSTLTRAHRMFDIMAKDHNFSGEFPLTQSFLSSIRSFLQNILETEDFGSIEYHSLPQESLLCIIFYLFLSMYIHTFSRKSPFETEMIPSALYIKGDLFIGCGLGSSASFSSSLAAVFLWFYQLHGASAEPSSIPRCRCLHHPSSVDASISPSFCHLQTSYINTWAYEGERLFHGTPSGADNYATVHGGIFSFRRLQSPPSSQAPAGIKRDARPSPSIAITPLQLASVPISSTSSQPSVVPTPPFVLIVVNSAVPRSAGAAVAHVRQLHSADATRFAALDAAVDTLARRAAAALQKYLGAQEDTAGSMAPSDEGHTTEDGQQVQTHEQLGQLFEENHKLLCEMEVSHDQIEKIRTVCRLFFSI